MNDIEEKQKQATKYYDKFAKVYDWISSKSYYSKPREFAFDQLDIEMNQIVLNIPCGTGQNFEYYRKYLSNSGTIVGIDISQGMLDKADEKIQKNDWKNVKTFKADVRKVDENWIKKKLETELKFDSIFCDLGLSGFPEWKSIIDNLISLLKPNGRIVIMDWYIDKSSFRGTFIKWIGKGEVNRPLYQYLENKVTNFKVNKSFKGGQMFVATGTRKE